MIFLKKNIILFINLFSMTSFAEVRLVLSAALTDAYFELRKEQYIKSFSILAQYGYGYENAYVVEALRKKGLTFLDDYSNHVFYATVDDSALVNKGINEARTLLEGFYHFNFDSEDMIIKLTGRYYLLSDYFLKLVEKNSDLDAIVKLDSCGQVLTLFFAMRGKYFCDMYEHIDYVSMERNRINIEKEVADYIQKKEKAGNFKVLYVDKLDVQANRFGSSTAPGASEISIY
jgi:hypothetical protein